LEDGQAGLDERCETLKSVLLRWLLIMVETVKSRVGMSMTKMYQDKGPSLGSFRKCVTRLKGKEQQPNSPLLRLSWRPEWPIANHGLLLLNGGNCRVWKREKQVVRAEYQQCCSNAMTQTVMKKRNYHSPVPHPTISHRHSRRMQRLDPLRREFPSCLALTWVGMAGGYSVGVELIVAISRYCCC
jgi:hypothetical protein